MYGRLRRVHFIGIGGVGMSGLAEVLLNLGYVVSGSDSKPSETTDRLRKMGGRIFIGHDARQVEGAQTVVYSSAIADENPELIAARALGLPVIPRAELLAELMRMKFGVAVAGAHGKTTTTTLIGSVLGRGGLDPTVVVGGRVHAFGSHARLGQGQFLVAEADESDGSFLRLTPAIAVITNLDLEHVDHYGGMGQIRQAFAAFASRVPFYGLIVVCAEDPEALAALSSLPTKRMMTYGLEAGEVRARDVQISPAGSRFQVTYGERRVGDVETRLVGRHNVLNALAAVCVGLELEIPFPLVRQGLAEFAGVGRRFEMKGEADGVLVVDDYGHHPTEIAATLSAARVHERRLVVVFQPHRYSRTHALAERFGESFADADVVLVTDVYAAGEKPIPGAGPERIVESARAHGHQGVEYVGDLAAAEARVAALVQPGDLLLTLGAGDVWKVGEHFVAERARTGERS
ncbi:MAG TPA: UDP-N-acetylmuramate--L-alanine ligase [Candidatus Eisenbacteria bacterium]|nr:UDP-N-acetylmuramate--L-alanine ligase [Candidatus Eisenbacteria bacterium]